MSVEKRFDEKIIESGVPPSRETRDFIEDSKEFFEEIIDREARV